MSSNSFGQLYSQLEKATQLGDGTKLLLNTRLHTAASKHKRYVPLLVVKLGRHDYTIVDNKKELKRTFVYYRRADTRTRFADVDELKTDLFDDDNDTIYTLFTSYERYLKTYSYAFRLYRHDITVIYGPPKDFFGRLAYRFAAHEEIKGIEYSIEVDFLKTAEKYGAKNNDDGLRPLPPVLLAKIIQKQRATTELRKDKLILIPKKAEIVIRHPPPSEENNADSSDENKANTSISSDDDVIVSSLSYND